VTDLPTDSPTHTGASQSLIASTDVNPTHNQKKNDESDKKGTNRNVYLRRERTDCHNFQNFTQELVECENGGVPRINGIRMGGHREKLGRHGGT